MFSGECYEIFKNSLFHRTPLVAASMFSKTSKTLCLLKLHLRAAAVSFASIYNFHPVIFVQDLFSNICLNHIQDGRGGRRGGGGGGAGAAKSPPSSYSPVTSTNIGIGPLNLSDF